ncbi:MAG: hypothetical protein LAP85_24760 [Acidobacteriia bacterium]|nr:hypothetical protein [Terriglobia bacterium]
MSKMFREIVASLVAVAVLVPLSGAAQRPPDLSGHWVLVTATAFAGGRGTGRPGTPQASGEVHTTSTTVSGAAFNCGTECTIVQKGQMLTVDKAHLASRPTPAPAVTLHLDGRQTSVIDSFAATFKGGPTNPRREIPVTAKWNGDTLEITSSTGLHTFTQLLSIEEKQLVVVTLIDIESAPPVTFKYKKK